MSQTKVTGAIDKIAVSTSTICAAHCLCLPLLLGVFPAIGATFLGDESFHEFLLWIVIPLSIVGLSLGCRLHKDRFVALTGFAGLIVIGLVALVGDDMLGELGERLATLAGSCAIAAGHVRNFRLCRRTNCAH